MIAESQYYSLWAEMGFWSLFVTLPPLSWDFLQNNVRLEENLEKFKTPLKKLDFNKLVSLCSSFLRFSAFSFLTYIMDNRKTCLYVYKINILHLKYILIYVLSSDFRWTRVDKGYLICCQVERRVLNICSEKQILPGIFYYLRTAKNF